LRNTLAAGRSAAAYLIEDYLAESCVISRDASHFVAVASP
jgi:hypothetical protein